MKKLRFLPLFLVLLLCMSATAFAAGIPGQQSIVSITDENGDVPALTDDQTATAWTKSDEFGVDLTINLYSGTVGEIWIRNGYAYTQNWYNNYDRPSKVKVTVYYTANQYVTSYDTYRYTLSDAYRPNTVSSDWISGYQRLLLPKQYRGVTMIEITVEGVINGFSRTGATISDIIVASGSHATATPRAYATATPRPYVVYITPTPDPEIEDDDPLVEFITPRPTEAWDDDDPLVEYITPRPTKTPLVSVITPRPTNTGDDDDPLVEYITPRPTKTPLVSVITPRPTNTGDEDEPLVEYITPRPTKTPLVSLITPTPKPADYPSRGGAIGYCKDRIPACSGPSLQYDKPGSFLSTDHEVKVTSKVWDDNNDTWWYHFEFQYKGEWYRLYATSKRFNVDASNVPVEPMVGDPLDVRKSLGEHEIYYGPGKKYARVPGVLIREGKQCEVYAIENGWAMVDYYDYARDTKRRGWIPVNILYAK